MEVKIVKGLKVADDYPEIIPVDSEAINQRIKNPTLASVPDIQPPQRNVFQQFMINKTEEVFDVIVSSCPIETKEELHELFGYTLFSNCRTIIDILEKTERIKYQFRFIKQVFISLVKEPINENTVNSTLYDFLKYIKFPIIKGTFDENDFIDKINLILDINYKTNNISEIKVKLDRIYTDLNNILKKYSSSSDINIDEEELDNIEEEKEESEESKNKQKNKKK